MAYILASQNNSHLIMYFCANPVCYQWNRLSWYLTHRHQTMIRTWNLHGWTTVWATNRIGLQVLAHTSIGEIRKRISNTKVLRSILVFNSFLLRPLPNTNFHYFLKMAGLPLVWKKGIHEKVLKSPKTVYSPKPLINSFKRNAFDYAQFVLWDVRTLIGYRPLTDTSPLDWSVAYLSKLNISNKMKQVQNLII